jgi:hypothetical protein
MKKVIIVLAGLFFSLGLFSQDLIIKKSGKKIHCRIVQEDSANVQYTISYDDTFESKYTIPRSDIQTINYGQRNTKKKKDTLNRFDSNVRYRNCFTIGILQGGGSLVGIDLEGALSRSFGIQAGVGFFGFGAGINYHLKSNMRKSFFSLQYWHQGLGESYTQSLLGPAFVFRGRRWFTAQIGIAAALYKGPGWPDSFDQPPIMLTYAIGFYLIR